MILKRPSFRRGGNTGIGSLSSRKKFNLGSTGLINQSMAYEAQAKPQIKTPFQMGEQRGQNIINKAKQFVGKLRTPSGILKALGTARVLTPGLSNPYFLAGAAAVVPPSVAMYQLNQARKRGELLDPVDNPYETEFGVLTQEDLQPEIGRQNVDEIIESRTETETEGSGKDGFEGEERPRKTYSEQYEEIAEKVIPNGNRSSGEKSYETAYSDEIKKIEKILGKSDYKGEVAIALSDAIGTPGSIADKASSLNKQLLAIMGAKKKKKGEIAKLAYDSVNRIKIAEIAAGKQTANEKFINEARALRRIINDPKSSEAEKIRAQTKLANLSEAITVLGKSGDSIQMRRDKKAALDQFNSSLFGIKRTKKEKDKKEQIEQLIAEYQTTVGSYPEFKEDLLKLIERANIKGLDVSKFSEGGRVKKSIGGDVEGMEETVKETVTEGPATPTAPVKKMTYAELRNRLPKEITDDVVQLIEKSQEAMQDFAYIRTQGDVDSFNLKYGVNLVLPANT